MKSYSLSHLSDSTLLRDLAALVARDRAITAALLAHLAEVDARKLYLPAAYPSMYAYCVQELRLSEQAAFKRIQAARAARRFPAIFEAVASGRLHLSAVVMLAPHLSEATAEGLLAAATHKSKTELEQLLAERFPRPDLPTLVQAISSTLPAWQLSPGIAGAPGLQLSPGIVGAPGLQLSPGPVGSPGLQLSPGIVVPGVRGRVEPPVRPARVAALAPERFALQLTMGQGTHDKLRYAQELLGHQIPSSDIAQVLDRALDALIRELEKARFAATDRPRRGRRRRTESARHIPAQVKRAVWERDGGRCTFVSETGHRCATRKLLEFDHIEPVARGGKATVTGMRLRCRAHNQYEAERVFGAGFMSAKREAAQRAAERRGGAAKRLATAESEAASSHTVRPATGGLAAAV